MKLKQLVGHIEDLTIKGSKEGEITGLTSHSNLVAPGNLFIAKRGKKHDGTQYIQDAVASGASAVLTDLYDPFLSVPQLIHPNVASIEAKLAAQFYGFPSQSLRVIGITGTNGKTTVSFLIRHLLEKAGILTGLIGTVEWIAGQHRFEANLTTPDVVTVQKLLKDMLQENCSSCVMEVSSHGLSQNRVDEIDFSMGIFTNLSPEHLDYHHFMENYRREKEKLFTRLSKDSFAIFNRDDPATFSTRAKVFTYGIRNEADLMAKDIRLSDKKTEFILCTKDQEVALVSPLIGLFNVYNILASVSAGICYGLKLEDLALYIKSGKGAPGRLQKVKDGVFVDFAHTELALKNVLETLREITKGKIITVFGCGGDRDRLKRPKMGFIASELSDEVIVTSDNPRSEDPEKIIQEIVSGCVKPVITQVDRAKAIALALQKKQKKDIVLIAGRGHEKKQIFDHYTLPFHDVEIAEKIYEEICIG